MRKVPLLCACVLWYLFTTAQAFDGAENGPQTTISFSNFLQSAACPPVFIFGVGAKKRGNTKKENILIARNYPVAWETVTANGVMLGTKISDGYVTTFTSFLDSTVGYFIRDSARFRIYETKGLTLYRTYPLATERPANPKMFLDGHDLAIDYANNRIAGIFYMPTDMKLAGSDTTTVVHLETVVISDTLGHKIKEFNLVDLFPPSTWLTTRWDRDETFGAWQPFHMNSLQLIMHGKKLIIGMKSLGIACIDLDKVSLDWYNSSPVNAHSAKLVGDSIYYFEDGNDTIMPMAKIISQDKNGEWKTLSELPCHNDTSTRAGGMGSFSVGKNGDRIINGGALYNRITAKQFEDAWNTIYALDTLDKPIFELNTPHLLSYSSSFASNNIPNKIDIIYRGGTSATLVAVHPSTHQLVYWWKIGDSIPLGTGDTIKLATSKIDEITFTVNAEKVPGYVLSCVPVGKGDLVRPLPGVPNKKESR